MKTFTEEDLGKLDGEVDYYLQRRVMEGPTPMDFSEKSYGNRLEEAYQYLREENSSLKEVLRLRGIEVARGKGLES